MFQFKEVEMIHPAPRSQDFYLDGVKIHVDLIMDSTMTFELTNTVDVSLIKI